MMQMGIPSRMAAAVQRMFGGLNVPRQRVVDAVLADDQRLPLADSNGAMTGPGAISVAALQAARECYEVCSSLHDEHAIKARIDAICSRRGVKSPVSATIGGYIARAADHAWWRRALRKELMRRFEHTSIQLGLTYVRADPYVSRETCLAQAAQKRGEQKSAGGRNSHQ